MLLDNGAQASVTTEGQLLNNIKKTDTIISGISAHPITAVGLGTITLTINKEKLDIPMYLIPESETNEKKKL